MTNESDNVYLLTCAILRLLMQLGWSVLARASAAISRVVRPERVHLVLLAMCACAVIGRSPPTHVWVMNGLTHDVYEGVSLHENWVDSLIDGTETRRIFANGDCSAYRPYVGHRADIGYSIYNKTLTLKDRLVARVELVNFASILSPPIDCVSVVGEDYSYFGVTGKRVRPTIPEGCRGDRVSHDVSYCRFPVTNPVYEAVTGNSSNSEEIAHWIAKRTTACTATSSGSGAQYANSGYSVLVRLQRMEMLIGCLIDIVPMA